MPQQPQQFSDTEMQQLANDPLFTDADFRRLADADKMRFLKAKGGKPLDAKFNLQPNLPPSAGDADSSRMFGRVAKVPGSWESILSLPASVASVYPPLKPFTAPIAALLGGAGSVADDLSAGEPLDLGSFIGGAARQGALQLTGNAISGPGARLTMSAAMPGAEKRAVEAALETGAGTNLPKAFDAAKKVGNEITDRVAQLPPIHDADVALLEHAPDLVARTARRSAKPLSTENALKSEIADVEAQTPRDMTALDVLEKKRGARTGYEALLSKEARNAPVAPPTKVQELYGNNAQKILESLDEQAYQPNSFEDSLKDINQRSGGIQELIQYLSGRGDRSIAEGLLPRFFLGTLAGALPEYLTGGGMERYGPAGILGGLSLGLAPSGTARTIQAAGRALPPLVRGTTAIVGLQRRKPQD